MSESNIGQPREAFHEVAMNANLPCQLLVVGVPDVINWDYLRSYLFLFSETFAHDSWVVTASGSDPSSEAGKIVAAKVCREFLELPHRQPVPDERSWSTEVPFPADLFVVLPATATVLEKVAKGSADFPLSTLIRDSPRPVVFVPKMRRSTWNLQTMQNVCDALRRDGHYVVPLDDATLMEDDNPSRESSPPPELALSHLMHVRLTALREGYWGEATSSLPLTPAQKKIREFQRAAERRRADQNGAVPTTQ